MLIRIVEKRHPQFVFRHACDQVPLTDEFDLFRSQLSHALINISNSELVADPRCRDDLFIGHRSALAIGKAT